MLKEEVVKPKEEELKSRILEDIPKRDYNEIAKNAIKFLDTHETGKQALIKFKEDKEIKHVEGHVPPQLILVSGLPNAGKTLFTEFIRRRLLEIKKGHEI